MLETTRKLIADVGKKLGLQNKQIDELIKTDAEHKFEIELSDGSKYQAYRIQHSNKLGPYKGGIRYHPQVNYDEVRALATIMSLKTAAIGLPMGGGKGGISVDPKQLSKEALEELSRKYVRHLYKHIGPRKDVPAPDVNTDAQIMDWMADEYEKLSGESGKAAFTGKSIKNGGSLGRDSATGRGGLIVIREILKKSSISNPITYSLQGWGNVGSFFALLAETSHPEWKLVAVTDSSGGVYKPTGLSAKELDKFKKSGGRLVDYTSGDKITNDDLIGIKTSVVVLAALEDAVNSKNANDVKSDFILEMANSPLSYDAYKALAGKGITIVPDILANAGGVIVSYLEWLQNMNDEHWPEDRVNRELENYLVKATDKIYERSRKNGMTLKESAIAEAITRLTA